MLEYIDAYVGSQEIPNEESLVIVITDYILQCRGKKAKIYKEKERKPLTKDELSLYIDSLIGEITCVVFLGGDCAPEEINDLAAYIREKYSDIKIGWYSADETITIFTEYRNFDYIKLGPYNQKRGGLNSPKTNQRLYMIEGALLIDITNLFWK